MTPAHILAFLLTLQPHFSDRGEPPEDRRARMTAIAEDIHAAAGGSRELVAALLTLGWEESRWARYVGEGCRYIPERSPNCDGGRARSYWQAWQVACPKAWRLPVRSRAAQLAFAKCSARLWRSAKRRCLSANNDPLVGAYSGYRSACRWEPARKRAHRHRVLLGRL